MKSHHKKLCPSRPSSIAAASCRAAAACSPADDFNEHGVVEKPQHVFVVGDPEQLECTIYAHPVAGGFIASFELVSLAHEVPALAQPFPGEHSQELPNLYQAVLTLQQEALRAARAVGNKIDRKAEAWPEKVAALESHFRGLLIDVLRKDKSLPLHGLTVAELCCGAGGAGLGFTLAGARIVLAVEIDPEARRIYQENVRPERMAADVCEIDGKDIEADILFIGMPCQAFSVAGSHQGLDDQERGPVYSALMRLFRTARAKVIVIECARQFLTRNRGADAAMMRRELMKAGFAVQQRVLSAECFGSPLARERAFMVATRPGQGADAIIDWLFPREGTPTKVVEDIMEQGLPATIPDAEITIHKTEPSTRQPRRVQVGYIAGRDRQGYRVYSPRGVGATLTASGGGRARSSGAYKVPGGARGLTPREAHRGMGFPEWFAAHPVATHAYRHAGNAVAVPVAHALACQLGAMLAPRP